MHREYSGQLLDRAFLRLSSDVFFHPVWTHFVEAGASLTPWQIQPLLEGGDGLLSAGKLLEACQILFICAFQQLRAGDYTSAPNNIQRILILAEQHGLPQVAQWATWGAAAVCVRHRDMQPGEPEMTEAEAIPAHPDNEYGWEKLYAERMGMAYERNQGIKVRIARFQNCYGPEGTWTGGREKAPAAMCRIVAEANDGDAIEVWGDGTAIRSYTYVGDMVDGIYLLMHSELHGVVSIGCPLYVTVDELATEVIKQSGKNLIIKHVKGPVGVQSRNFSNGRIYSLGWQAKVFLEDGIRYTYPWVEAQVKAKQAVAA